MRARVSTSSTDMFPALLSVVRRVVSAIRSLRSLLDHLVVSVVEE
jgi:hypothetical protein